MSEPGSSEMRPESAGLEAADQARPVERVLEQTAVRALEWLIEAVALFLLAFSPIAFGATEQWSKLVVEVGVCAMAGLWCSAALLKRRMACVKSPLNLLIAGFILLACLQLVPLPGFLASRLSPATVWTQTGTLPGANTPGVVDPARAGAAAERASACISVNRAAGTSFLFLVVSYAVVFLVVVNVVRRRSRVSRLLTAVVAVGFVVAMLGILGKATPNGRILWLRAAPAGAIPFGPFVNRNHFAGYLVMVIPIALGLMISTRNRDKKTLLGFAAAVMAAAVLISASRGGVLSLGVGSTVFALLLVCSHSARRNLFPLAVVGLLAVAGAVTFGIEPLLSRTSDLVEKGADQYRWGVWKDTARMVAGFPVFGVGLGCFRSVFPVYKTISEQLLFSHVENDYLQLLAEMGVAGFAIGLTFIVLIMRYSLRSLGSHRSSYTRGLIIGLVAAAAGMLAHSFVDFNLHVPSNGLLFAVVLGLLAVLGSMHISRKGALSKAMWIGAPSFRLLRGETVLANGAAGAFSLSVALLCLLAFCVASGAGSLVAHKQLDSVEQQATRYIKGESGFNVVDAVRGVQMGIAKDGGNPEWHFRAGLFYQTLGQIKTRTVDPSTPSGTDYLYKLATAEFLKACQLDSLSSNYRASLAVALAEAGRIAEARQAFAMAASLDPTNAWIFRKYGAAVWEADQDLAQAAFRRALDLDPHCARTVLAQLYDKTHDLDAVRRCVPGNHRAQFEFAGFLMNSHMPAESEAVLAGLLPALESDADRRELAGEVFFHLGQLRQERGSEQEAMAYFLKAVALQPERQTYHEELGYAYLRQRRYDDARKSLERRLRMGPAGDGNVFLALGEIYENIGTAGTARQYYSKALDSFPPTWDVSRAKALQGLKRTEDQ